MKENEARELLLMMKSATTRYPLPDEKVDFWISSLSPLNADFATKAVMAGINTWEDFPSWAEFQDLYREQQRREREERLAETAHLMVEEGKRGEATPEWVWVWSWARWMRDPPEERPFPQQRDFADMRLMMTTQDYEALRAEWLAAGRPKAQNPLPTMAGGPKTGGRHG